MFIVSGAYVIKQGKREEFMREIYSKGIIAKIRGEKGNISYNYFYPYDSNSRVYFVEQWENRADWEAHCQSPHIIGELKTLKDVYMTDFEPGILGCME